MPKQTPVIRNKLSPDPGTEPTLNQPIPGKETKELLYSNEEFENFLKHAELAGISRKRQDELIAMFLAEDVTLEEIILDSFQKLVQIMSKYRVRIMMFVLVLGLVVFVQDSFDRASMGYQEYQPWQFEMSAKMKNWQIKHMQMLDINFDKADKYFKRCTVHNPYYSKTSNFAPKINCVNSSRGFTYTNASSYRGVFYSKKFPLPLVLHEAQSDWVLNKRSTLEDLYKILAANLDVTFPCVNYIGEVEPAPEWSRDPLRALIDGKLAKEDGTSIDVIFLEGCTSKSNKVMRGLTKRPKFLDPHIESLKAIKGIVGKGIPEGTSAKATIKPYDPDTPRELGKGYYWLAQVIGKSVVTLKDLDCRDNKPNVYTMKPGDIVAVRPKDSVEVDILGPKESFLLYTNFKPTPR